MRNPANWLGESNAVLQFNPVTIATLQGRCWPHAVGAYRDTPLLFEE